MIYVPYPKPQGLGLIFAVAHPIHVNKSKLKSNEECACRYLQCGPLGPGLKLLPLVQNSAFKAYFMTFWLFIV